MKRFAIRGQRLHALKVFGAISAVLVAIVFCTINFNLINANAQDDNVLSEQENSSLEFTDINRASNEDKPFTVKALLFNNKEFIYEDAIEDPGVKHPATVLEATFPTSERITCGIWGDEDRQYRISGSKRGSSDCVDHDFYIHAPQGCTPISASKTYVDDYTLEISIVYGENYDITLYTDKGVFENNNDTITISVIEGRHLGAVLPHCVGYCFIGYTYDGLEGSIINENTLVPSKGVWPNTLKAVWQKCSDKFDLSFNLDSDSEVFHYNYNKSSWSEGVIEQENGTSKKIEIANYFSTDEEIVSYGTSVRNGLMDVSVSSKDVSGDYYNYSISFWINSENDNIIDYVTCNGITIPNEYYYGFDNDKPALTYVVHLKQSQDDIIKIISPNKALFRCFHQKRFDGREFESEYVNTSNLDVVVPAGYFATYSYGPVQWSEEQPDNTLNLNNNVNDNYYSDMRLIICLYKYDFDEENKNIIQHYERYVIADKFILDSLEKKTDVKNVFYCEEQLIPQDKEFQIKDNSQNFIVNVFDNNPAVYDVTFDANGGSFSDGNSNADVSQKVTTKYNFPEVPMRDGYDFAGWYSLADEGDLYTAETYVWDPEDENESNTDMLYAHWTPSSENKLAQTGDMIGAIVLTLMIVAALSSVVILRTRKNKLN